MKISLNWIKKFVRIPERFSARGLAELLTIRTCEVEAWQDQTQNFNGIVVGKIKKLMPHSNADKLKLCDTDIGGRTVQIVCGGSNVKEELIVAVALPGAKVNWHGAGETVELKETRIRGEKSFGMICAGEEIGLEKSPDGTIMDLSRLDSVKPGTPLAEALKLDDVIFEIDNKSITHRPDLWGHYGMAREFAGFLSQKLEPYEKAAGFSKIKFPIQKFPVQGDQKVDVKIQNEKISPRFCAVILENVKIEPSPEWMQKQLRACGVRPINNVVDITNYVMLELGQPMHAFDRKTVATDTLEIRYAKEGEILETIDHKKRKLGKEDAVISNGKKLLSLAGIMGGKDSEISGKTTEIIFEAANWNPIMIRKTSQRLGLRSDASQRFEKSLDPDLCHTALARACGLLLEMCGNAKLAGPMTDRKSKYKKDTVVKISAGKVTTKIGVPIPRQEIAKYLSSLGFETDQNLNVKVPSYRATKDVSIEDDLIEEVARMYGYEKIPSTLPRLPIKLPKENTERKLKHRSRGILSLGLGFTETLHYSFYSRNDLKKCLLEEKNHLKIQNPLSEDQTHMRISLVPNLLKSIAKNEPQFPDIDLYEIGRIYKKSNSYFPAEEKYICAAVTREKSKKEILYEAKGAAENFLAFFGAEKSAAEKSAAEKPMFEEMKNPAPYAHPKKSADIFINGKNIGGVFELHPLVKQNFGIEGEIALFEINFTLLASLKLPEKKYRPIPKFPGINIDVSVIAERKTRSLDIERLIKKTDKNLIRGVDLTDIFEGGTIGAGKKSLTYRIRLEAEDRTLTDDEMHGVQEKIFHELKRGGYEIRGLKNGV